MRKRDGGKALNLVDISAPDFNAESYGISREAADGKLHAFTVEGEMLTAMAAIRAAYRAIGWGWVYAPTGWPVLKPICDRLYRLFARNRKWLGNLLP